MDITVEELKKRLDAKEELVLIDVREPHEHEEFNVGGELIPVGTIVDRLDDLMKHKEDEVILYCRSGNRSGMAQNILRQVGFTNARNLEGGMLAWQDKFPV